MTRAGLDEPIALDAPTEQECWNQFWDIIARGFAEANRREEAKAAARGQDAVDE